MRPVHNHLYDQLAHEISHGCAEERFALFMSGIADRIEACRANPVKLSDLTSILREHPKKMSDAVLCKKAGGN
ncbi:MAG: hypothetical protein ABI076_10850 [Acidobacteriaceae bacterium]